MDVRNIDASAQRFFRRTAHKLGNLFRPEGRDSIATVEGSTSLLGADELHELELLGECLHIDKQMISDGEISIRKEVITETQVLYVPVKREELVVERRSMDGKSVEILRGQQQLRIPISKEQVIIRKEPVIAEVVKIHRRQIGESKRISATVKHEELRAESEGDVRISEDGTKAA
jgi:uncharacterized protein (TIGR02271 family)